MPRLSAEARGSPTKFFYVVSGRVGRNPCGFDLILIFFALHPPAGEPTVHPTRLTIHPAHFRVGQTFLSDNNEQTKMSVLPVSVDHKGRPYLNVNFCSKKS